MMCNITVAVEEDPVQASRKKRNVQVNVVQADGKYSQLRLIRHPQNSDFCTN